MFSTRTRTHHLARATAAAMAISSFGCGIDEGAGVEGGIGQIELAVGGQALTEKGIILVDIACEPDAGGGTFTRHHEIRRNSEAFTSRFGGLPVGTCDFLAEAYDTPDTTGEPTYAGSATGVRIAPDEISSLVIVLQGRQSSDPFYNSTPYITSLIASAGAVAPGGTIEFQVAASDEQDDADGIPLNYAWSASGGSLTGADSPTPTWQAPPTDVSERYDISVRVGDSDGSSTLLTVQVAAGLEFAHGGATTGFQLEMNHGPRVRRISSVQVAAISPAGEELLLHELEVIAGDPEGLPLDHAWSTNPACARFLLQDEAGGASWSESASGERTLVQVLDPAGCDVAVVATEVRGDGIEPATGRGTIRLRPAGRPLGQEPLILRTWQSHPEVHGQQEVELSAEIVVPYDAALPHAAWEAETGTIVAQDGPGWIDPHQPELGALVTATWEAPSCFLEPAKIRLVATDARGAAWTAHTFTVESLISTCP